MTGDERGSRGGYEAGLVYLGIPSLVMGNE